MVTRISILGVAVVTVLGAAVVLAGEACATASSAQTTQPSPVVLRVGETASIAGLNVSVTFDAVRSDSRCPTDARCIRAGAAVVALRLRASDAEAAELTAAVPPGGGTSETSGHYALHVVSLEPQTRGEVEIAQGDYRITVIVEER